MSQEPTDTPAVDRVGDPVPPPPAGPPPAPRSSKPPWEAIVAVSTAAGVIIALIVGLPNLRRSDTPAPAHSATSAASPSPAHASIAILSPAFTDRVPVTCVGTACAVEVRGRFDGAGKSVQPYVLIAYECCPGSTLSYYVQWDSTQQISGGDFTARAYVAKPQPGATFQLRAVLTTQPVRPAPSGDDLIIWSDSMVDKFGVVAQSDLVTMKVSGVVEATAFCDCPR